MQVAADSYPDPLSQSEKLACALPGLAQIDSHYRRLQRFFNSGLSPSLFTQLILNKLVVSGQAVTLVLDRTH